MKGLINISLMLSLFLPQLLCAQYFPQDFDYSTYTQWMLDSGELWESNTMFHPLQAKTDSVNQDLSGSSVNQVWVRSAIDYYLNRAMKQQRLSTDNFALLSLVGFESRHEEGPARQYSGIAFASNVFLNARFKNDWFATFVVRSTNEPSSLPHFSGRERGISRFGFSAGEVDQAWFGYQNEWATVSYGRTREIWGPMTDDNLVLSSNSPPWEEFSLQVRYKRLTYRFFCGFLEAIDSAHVDGIEQRYIVGRGLEYNNHRNLVLGISEVTILAGVDRPPDFSLFNPLAFEIEVEQNHRGNSRSNSSYANAVWVGHIDYLARQNLRLAGSFLLDEIQLDRGDIQKGRTNLIGYLFHVAWTPIRQPAQLTFLVDGVHIGTYTMMHSKPWTVFSTRGHFIGHPIGNDADKYSIGTRVSFRFPLTAEASLGMRRWGDNSLLKNPYLTYEEILNQSFPSGHVRKNQYFEFTLNSQVTKYLSLISRNYFDLNHTGTESAMQVWLITARFQLDFIHAF